MHADEYGAEVQLAVRNRRRAVVQRGGCTQSGNGRAGGGVGRRRWLDSARGIRQPRYDLPLQFRVAILRTLKVVFSSLRADDPVSGCLYGRHGHRTVIPRLCNNRRRAVRAQGRCHAEPAGGGLPVLQWNGGRATSADTGVSGAGELGGDAHIQLYGGVRPGDGLDVERRSASGILQVEGQLRLQPGRAGGFRRHPAQYPAQSVWLYV